MSVTTLQKLTIKRAGGGGLDLLEGANLKSWSVLQKGKTGRDEPMDIEPFMSKNYKIACKIPRMQKLAKN